VQLLGAVNKSFKNRLKPQWRSFAKIKSIFSLDFSLVLLWSRPFKIANSKVNNRYIIVLPEFFGKNANLRLELNIQDYGNKSIGS